MIFTAQINLVAGAPPASLFGLIWNMLPPPSRALLKLESKEITFQLTPPVPAGTALQLASAVSGMTGFVLDPANTQYRLDVPFSLGDLSLSNFGGVAAGVNITVVQED